MNIKLILFVSPLMAVQSICYAQQVEKNGLPCVAEICLGDGIPELSKVHWDRAKNPFSAPKRPLYTSTRKLKEYEIKSLKTTFPGDLGLAAPFLLEHLFDSGALSPLSHVSVACSAGGFLDGTYTTDSGNPTRVRIELVPNISDTTKQKWTVTFIDRSFPKAVSNEQRNEVKTQLAERYKDFNKGNLYIPKIGEGIYSENIVVMGPFGFNLSLFAGLEGYNNRLKLHPKCGGTEKVNID